LTELWRIVEPHLCGMFMHHVRVLDPEASHDSLDLFCGETAILRRLPMNGEAIGGI
jgi:hypothetical protein